MKIKFSILLIALFFSMGVIAADSRVPTEYIYEPEPNDPDHTVDHSYQDDNPGEYAVYEVPTDEECDDGEKNCQGKNSIDAPEAFVELELVVEDDHGKVDQSNINDPQNDLPSGVNLDQFKNMQAFCRQNPGLGDCGAQTELRSITNRIEELQLGLPVSP